MVSLDKLKVIAKAKFSDKSKLGDWYQDRLEICSKCPFNSKNATNMSVKDKAKVAANLGKPTCLACGCEIAAKASVRSEQCGLVYKGEDPLWPSLPGVEEVDAMHLTIKNLSSDKIRLEPVGRGIEIDFGTVPHKFDATAKLELVPVEGELTNVKVVPGCGCTSASSSTEDGRAIISIGYDTVGRRGAATKNVSIYYTLNKKKYNLMCKLHIFVQDPK